MIKYENGDVLTTECDIVIHGCNCFKVMGSGVAKHIHEKYPEAYVADLNYGEYGDNRKLGTYSLWSGGHKINKPNRLTIINLYTQFYPNPKLKPFDYEAFEVGFKKVLLDFPDKTIAMPKIGSGLAGGDWDRIESMINQMSGDREIIIYVL